MDYSVSDNTLTAKVSGPVSNINDYKYNTIITLFIRDIRIIFLHWTLSLSWVF